MKHLNKHLILCKEKMKLYKKNGYETHKFYMKLKTVFTKKGFTGEFCDWLESK